MFGVPDVLFIPVLFTDTSTELYAGIFRGCVNRIAKSVFPATSPWLREPSSRIGVSRNPENIPAYSPELVVYQVESIRV